MELVIPCNINGHRNSSRINRPSVGMTLGLLIVMAGLFCTGCKKKPDAAGSATNTSSGNPLTAPADYLGAAAKAQRSATKLVDTVGINVIKLRYRNVLLGGIFAGLAVVFRNIARRWVPEIAVVELLGAVILVTGVLHMLGQFRHSGVFRRRMRQP